MDSVYRIQDTLESRVERLELLADQSARGTSGDSTLNNGDRFDGIAVLQELRTENQKLRYQIDILKASIAKLSEEAPEVLDSVGQSPNKSTEMKSIYQELTRLFQEALSRAYPTLSNVEIVLQQSDFADFQCNTALKLTKLAKKPPVEIAKTIIAQLEENDLIESVTVSGPGFINIIIKPSFVNEQILNVIVNGAKMRLAKEDEGQVVVDYSSPNIAKEMHVGHLRSTIIGDSIAKLLEFVGHKVLRVNHVGDWGTQFGMLLAHLMDTYPDYKTTTPPIEDLVTFYKESKRRFDEEEAFKKRAYETTVRLQAKEPDMIKAWTLICDISRQEFQEVYRRLGISEELIERGESFYHDRMLVVVKDLTERGLLIEEEGRKVFYPEDKNLPPMTIVKSDGGFTYDTSDMATIRQRVEEERASRIIYTTDAGQATHFKILFSCAKLASYYDPAATRVDHVPFGVVLGEDKKRFKTRSGETVRLKDLINEGLERAMQKLKEKGRDQVLTPEELIKAQEAVAIGCIKYSDLSHDRNHDYVFSFDRMLDDRGNTAVYLLYALTRIRSIIRNANLTQSVTEIGQQLISSSGLKLEHPREIKLAKFILNFPDVIVEIVNTLCPHTLCKYLFDLSVIFSEFYDQCYVIEKVGEETKVNLNRIVLCEATARIMETALHILGIQTVEKM